MIFVISNVMLRCVSHYHNYHPMHLSFKCFKTILTNKEYLTVQWKNYNFTKNNHHVLKFSHLLHFHVIHILSCFFILVYDINYTCKVKNIDDLMVSSVSTLLKLVKCGLEFFHDVRGCHKSLIFYIFINAA